MYNFILTGPHAGKTINLGGFQFVDGVHTMPIVEGVAPSTDDVKNLGEYLGKCYQAFQEGSSELKAAQAGQTAPAQTVKPAPKAGDDDRAVKVGALRDALTKLDPENDEHWTGQGLPSVEAVRELAGSSEVSRKDIEEAAPKLTREEAKKARDEDPLNE